MNTEKKHYSNGSVISDERVLELEENLETFVLQVKANLKSLNVAVPKHCDQFIARCVRVKNYDTEKATRLFLNFGDMMRLSAMQDLYENFKPSDLKDLYKNGALTPLLQRDSFGRLIIVGRAGPWNPVEFNFDKALTALIILMDYTISQSKQLQNTGVIFVFDFRDWTLQQVRSVKLSRVKLIVKLMQNCTPAKIKGMHLIYQPKVVTAMFHVVKPFLKAKLASRVHFHGNEESLNNVLGPHFLSETIAGINKGYDNVVDNMLLLELSQRNDYYEEMVKYGYPSY